MGLAMMLCLVTVGLVGTPLAHAAVGPLTTTTTTAKTSTVKASARLCAFLQKSFPARAGDAHLCDITIVATDVVTRTTGAQSTSLSPSSCYPVNHSAAYSFLGGAAGFSQSETFTYGCTPAPMITNHRCYGLWNGLGQAMSQLGCYQYPNGYGHTQAEDDVVLSFSVGGTIEPRGFSDGQPNASIYDWCQC